MKTDIFLFDEAPVRVAMIDDEPWFIAKDAAGILGIKNHKDAISNFPADERDGVDTTDPIGRTQRTTVISEPGLYRLIFQSRKAEAERFKKWVFHEVLPAIRQTGCYLPAGGVTAELEDLKRTLKAAIDGVVAGTMPTQKAQTVALLAQRWLEAHRMAEDSYGPDKTLPGLPGRRAAQRLLSPEKRGNSDSVQAVPQPGVPAEGEGEGGLPGAPEAGEATVGSSEPETETPARGPDGALRGRAGGGD